MTTLELAETYFATRLHTRAWDFADDDKKQKALNDGIRIVNQFAYIGELTASDQANQWPRIGVVGQATDTVPANIQNAIHEIAHALLKGVDPEKELEGTRVVARAFSSVRTAYDNNRIPEHILNGVPSATAWMLLMPYLRRDNSGVIKLNRID